MVVLSVACPHYQAPCRRPSCVICASSVPPEEQPSTSTLVARSQRTRCLPQRLSDSAIQRELEISVSTWDSDQGLSDTEDMDWVGERLAYSTEEDTSVVQPALSATTAGLSVAVSGAVAAIGTPESVPSTSRGIVGSGPGVSPMVAPATATPRISATSLSPRSRRRLVYSFSSSGEDAPLQQASGRSRSRSRSRGVGRQRVRGGRCG